MTIRPVQVVLPRHIGDCAMALPALARLSALGDRPVRVLAAGAAADAVRGQGPFSVHEPSALGPGPAVLLAGSLRVAIAAVRAGSSPRIGLAGDLRRPLLTHVVPEPPNPLPGGPGRLPKLLPREHQADAYLRVVEVAIAALGGARSMDETVATYVIDRASEARGQQTWEAAGRPTVVLHPCIAGAATKAWPETRWAELVRTLPGCVVTGGPHDGELVARVAGAAPQLAGADALPIPAWAALARLAGTVVAPDTGVAHIARAAGARVVALFGPTDPARHAPRGPGTLTLLHGGEGLPCSPCYADRCAATPSHACMHALDVPRVAAAAGGAR